MNGITLFIFFCFYKLISFYIWWIVCTSFISKYLLTFCIYISCFYSWTRCLFKLINMNYITIFVIFSFNKFISWNIFFVLFSIFILSKRISFFINKFSNYRWTRSSFLLVDMFCIALIISFGSYKFISINSFIRFCTIFLRSYSLTIFINEFCNYSWCRSSFLLIDMFCITFIISFGAYKFISINFFIRLFTIFLRSYSLTIFINEFSNYIWNKFPCSCEFYIFIFYSFLIFVIFYKFPSTIFYFYFFCFWHCRCYFVAFYFASLICW